MPCNDGGYTPACYSCESAAKAQRTAEARLCAVLSALEGSKALDMVLGDVNWKEAGLSREKFTLWWEMHKAQDKKRREREVAAKAAEEKRKALVAAATAKLTPEELRALKGG